MTELMDFIARRFFDGFTFPAFMATIGIIYITGIVFIIGLDFTFSCIREKKRKSER